jgi:hypothetical protein
MKCFYCIKKADGIIEKACTNVVSEVCNTAVRFRPRPKLQKEHRMAFSLEKFEAAHTALHDFSAEEMLLNAVSHEIRSNIDTRSMKLAFDDGLKKFDLHDQIAKLLYDYEHESDPFEEAKLLIEYKRLRCIELESGTDDLEKLVDPWTIHPFS